MKRFIIFFLLLAFSFAQKKNLSIQDLISNSDFRMKGFRGTQWTPDGNGYVFLAKGGTELKYYDIKTGKESVYIAAEDAILEAPKRAKRFMLKNFFWSPANTDDILVPKGNDLYLYKRSSKKLIRLTHDEKLERDPIFSPDGRKVAYLKDNNLFYVDIDSKKETQLTKQGTDKVLIGRFDWVYEEEFSIRTGFFWSPNSDRIAYFELHDANTPRFPIVDFVPIENTVNYLPYPKAGRPNSEIKIAVVDIEDAKNTYMQVSANKDELIPRIKWTNENDDLCILKMNRDQDLLEVYLAEVDDDGEAKLLFKEEQKDGWIDINDSFTFIEDNLLWVSRKDGYNHIYLYDEDGSLVRQLTKGKWEVTKVHGYDKKTKRVYFTAAKRSPLERELYSVPLKGGKVRLMTKKKGYHRINMNSSFSYFLDNFSNLTTAPIVDLKNIKGKRVKNMITNSTAKLKKYNLGKHELLTVKTSDGTALNAYMIKPADFDKSKRYPVLMFQYSGPGSQQVANRFSLSLRDRWHHLLTEKGIIVFCVDGRGTGFRGREFEQITNHDLGNYESLDQFEATKYLRSLAYVDGNKIGIWGWSYGGYMSSLAIMKYPDAFNLAIAVAPVTNWRNYDTIYTERFMSTPNKNPNYDHGAPAHYAHQLKNPFLLIHGTGDDNVHLSNSVQLVEKLVKNEKQFEQFFYPRSQHGMTYDFPHSYMHLYTMMTNFVLKHFKQERLQSTEETEKR